MKVVRLAMRIGVFGLLHKRSSLAPNLPRVAEGCGTRAVELPEVLVRRLCGSRRASPSGSSATPVQRTAATRRMKQRLPYESLSS
jgi:hypothetical protein